MHPAQTRQVPAVLSSGEYSEE